MVVPNLTLNNLRKIPILGFGTWKSDPGQVAEVVKNAIKIGYRHIDCAFIYGNESEIGQAFEEVISSNVVKREDLFITSKVWNTFHSKEMVRKCLMGSLENLKVDYLDLLHIHWPMGYKEGEDLFPKDENGKFQYSDIDYLETWKEMEKCVEDGLVKSIGLSNCNHKQIDRIISNCTIQPSVLQVECHPYLNQKRLIDFCKSKNIVVTAYSPLGSPARPWVTEKDPVVLEDATIKAIAEKYGKSTAQVSIRFQIDRGVTVIPKSVTKSRIEANFNVFDFKLNDEDIQAIEAVNKNYRCLALEWVKDHPYYPFHEEY